MVHEMVVVKAALKEDEKAGSWAALRADQMVVSMDFGLVAKMVALKVSLLVAYLDFSLVVCWVVCWVD